jgi:protein-tyrosine-phosphatase
LPYQGLILLVCSGNLCRSPMAEAMLRTVIERHGDAERLRVSSAGTWCPADQPVAPLTIEVMAAWGQDLSAQRTRVLTQPLIDDADLILVMTRDHLRDIQLRFARAEDKTYLLTEMVGKLYDIADPYGGTREVYEACRRELEDVLTRGYARIVALASGEDKRKRSRAW